MKPCIILCCIAFHSIAWGLPRRLSADNGVPKGLGMGTLHRQEVGGLTVAFNLQVECLMAVGHEQLIAMEDASLVEGVTGRTRSGTRQAQ